MNLIAELKRRNVVKIGAAYLLVAVLAVQAASVRFPPQCHPAGATDFNCD